MSNTILAPALARDASSPCAAPRPWSAVEKCVPVTTIARARRMKRRIDVALVERHVGAVLAVEDAGESCRNPARPGCTSAVSRSGSVMMPSMATPSRAICSRMKRPICSSPTRVETADLRPRRAAPIAMLEGQPPTDLAKRAHVLQPAADLLAVEIDRGAPDGDDVKVLGHLAFLPSVSAQRRERSFASRSQRAKMGAPYRRAA